MYAKGYGHKLYAFLISALHGNECLTLCPSKLYSWAKSPRCQLDRKVAGAILNAVVKRKFQPYNP
jgi:hypothetical protein